MRPFILGSYTDPHNTLPSLDSQPVQRTANTGWPSMKHKGVGMIITVPIRGGWDDPNCARRTSTFLSCAFREQRDHPSYPVPLLDRVLKDRLRPNRLSQDSTPLEFVKNPSSGRIEISRA